MQINCDSYQQFTSKPALPAAMKNVASGRLMRLKSGMNLRESLVGRAGLLGDNL
jgi:hypothetical protein